MDGSGVTSTTTDTGGRRPGRRLSPQADDGAGAVERPLRAGHRPLSLRMNFSWSLLGNVVFIATRYGMVVLLTQLGGAEMMARGMKGFFICAPFAALGNLGLRNVLVTDARGEYRFGDYLGLRMITASAALLLTAGTVAAMGYEAEAVWIILLVAIGKLFESLGDIFDGLQQQHERMDRASIAIMLRGALALLGLAVGVHLSGSLMVGMIGFPLAMAATFVLWDLPQGLRTSSASAGDGLRPGGSDAIRGPARVRPRWNAGTLGSLAWLSLPLAVVATEVALFQNLPRYMVEYFLGLASLGVFHAIGSIVAAGFMLVTSMGVSASPRLAKCYAEGNATAFYRLLFKLLGLVACLGAGGVIVMWLFASPLLDFVYGDPEITKGADLAVWMMVFAAFMYLNGPLGRALDATRQFRIHLAIRTIGILLALGLLPVLIRWHGLTGAALAMIVSAACLTGLYVAAIVRTVKRISPPEGRSS